MKELVKNTIKGIGSAGSEEVSSPVAASRIVMTGYSSVVVFAPYRSFVVEGNK